MMNVFEPHMEVTTDPKYAFVIKIAYEAAMMYSDDPFTKVGANLFKEDPDEKTRVYFKAANSVNPNTVPEVTDSLRTNLGTLKSDGISFLLNNITDRDWKYANITHAERAVIEMAQKAGADLSEYSMAMPWVPCSGHENSCSAYIVRSGIPLLVTHKQMVLKTPERWWESTNNGLDEIQKAGVKCLMYDGEIGGVVSHFNSEIWLP